MAGSVSRHLQALTPSNFTRSSNLKRSVRYARPLTQTERDQNYGVNGLVSGKGYVGGRFRGNWQFSVEAPADGTLDIVGPSGSMSLALLKGQIASLTAGQTAYIVNTKQERANMISEAQSTPIESATEKRMAVGEALTKRAMTNCLRCLLVIQPEDKP